MALSPRAPATPIRTSDQAAYSYARYSSGKQSIGSSEARQVEQAREWATRKGIRLIEEVFDRGYSGFHGDHRKRGAFGKFLADLKNGMVPHGSYLVIEAMNRLSRETPYDAQGTLRELLDGGIVLVVLYRGEMEIDRERARRTPRLLADLHQDIEIAHQQSKEKSDMAIRNWSRLVKLIQSGVPVTAHCPGWLRVVGEKRRYGKIDEHGKFEAHPERWKTVKEIIKLRMAGNGLTTIAGKLNEQGVRPFQDMYKGKQTSGWSDSSIKFILRHPALHGEYVFRRKVDGILPDPVSGYYPPVVTKGQWLLLQHEMNNARKTGGGRRLQKIPNLFDGLLWCATCGGPMHLSGNGPASRYQYRRYGCDHYRRKVRKEVSKSLPLGQCTHKPMWQAPLVEGLILYYLFMRLNPDSFRGRENGVDPLEMDVAQLSAEIAEIEEKIARGKIRLMEERDERRYHRLQGQLDIEEPKAAKLRRRLVEAETLYATASHGSSPAQEIEKLRVTCDSLTGNGNDTARERLRLAIRRVVERIEVGPKPIPYYFANDGRGFPLIGPSKGIPRYPTCTILLKWDKVMLTGEPPSLKWQEEVMNLALPNPPAKKKPKKLLEPTGSLPTWDATTDRDKNKIMISLRNVFLDVHDLESGTS